MALNRYDANVNGIDTVLNLTADEAEERGLKRHQPVQNKARGAESTARPAGGTKRAARGKGPTAAEKKAAADAAALEAAANGSGDQGSGSES